MTTADTYDRPDRDGKTRWTISLLIVLALHAGLVLITTLRHVAIEPIGLPPAAVMIDLAPLPTAAPASPAVQPKVETPPPEPQQEMVPLPEPAAPKLEPSPAPHPAVTFPAAQPPKAKPKAKRVEHPPTPQPEAEPAPPPRQPAPAAAAPASPTAQPSAPQSAARAASSAASARASWQALLLAWLEKYKRYPRVAQEQHQQGVVYLRFAIDRQGKILFSQINKSSGFELLDDEVLALVQRAQPVPSLPPEVSVELLVPIAFSLRR